MTAYLWIAAGGAIGSVARYLCQVAATRMIGETFPWGTLLVNIAGCTIIGFIAGFTGPDGRVQITPTFREFVMVGICGGFTTFSSFSLETLSLARDGQWPRAALYVGVSFAICLIGVWLGYAAAAALNRQ